MVWILDFFHGSLNWTLQNVSEGVWVRQVACNRFGSSQTPSHKGPYVYPFSSWKPGQSWLSPAEESHCLHCQMKFLDPSRPQAPQWRLSRGLTRVLPVESLNFLSGETQLAGGPLMIKLGIWGSTCISHFHGPKTVPNNEQDFWWISYGTIR